MVEEQSVCVAHGSPAVRLLSRPRHCSDVFGPSYTACPHPLHFLLLGPSTLEDTTVCCKKLTLPPRLRGSTSPRRRPCAGAAGGPMAACPACWFGSGPPVATFHWQSFLGFGRVQPPRVAMLSLVLGIALTAVAYNGGVRSREPRSTARLYRSHSETGPDSVPAARQAPAVSREKHYRAGRVGKSERRCRPFLDLCNIVLRELVSITRIERGRVQGESPGRQLPGERRNDYDLLTRTYYAVIRESLASPLPPACGHYPPSLASRLAPIDHAGSVRAFALLLFYNLRTAREQIT
nr:hypothetical protein Iba_chr08eCG6630 [Ipomoea batatas]